MTFAAHDENVVAIASVIITEIMQCRMCTHELEWLVNRFYDTVIVILLPACFLKGPIDLF